MKCKYSRSLHREEKMINYHWKTVMLVQVWRNIWKWGQDGTGEKTLISEWGLENTCIGIILRACAKYGSLPNMVVFVQGFTVGDPSVTCTPEDAERSRPITWWLLSALNVRITKGASKVSWCSAIPLKLASWRRILRFNFFSVCIHWQLDYWAKVEIHWARSLLQWASHRVMIICLMLR